MSTPVRIITITAEELRGIIREEVRDALAQARPAEEPARGRDPLVSVPAAAKATGQSEDSIRALISQGRIPDRRAGGGRGHYRVRVSEVEEAMRRDREAPVDEEATVVSMLARRR